MKKLILSIFLISSLALTAAEPKKVLVVGVTTEFRHSSIETAEKILQKLGEDSKAFTVVDVAKQPSVKIPQKPSEPRKPAALKADADEKAKAKYESELKKYESDLAKYQAAIAKWTRCRSTKNQRMPRLNHKSQLNAAMDKLSPENLKNYDAVIFANTTGDLSLPSLEGFINWIREGHAFIGMHSASDTLHHDNWTESLHRDARWRIRNPRCPGFRWMRSTRTRNIPHTKHLGDTFTVFDEIYIIKSYHPETSTNSWFWTKHPNTQKPGHYPISWCKEFGKGKVFYTSLGHREDVWNPEEKGRKNSKEVSEAYQQHILGGIKWALGLAPGDATPQTSNLKSTLLCANQFSFFIALVALHRSLLWRKRVSNRSSTAKTPPAGTCEIRRHNSWTIEDGILKNTVNKGEHGTDLVTDQKFWNYTVKYEFMVPDGSNSGFYMRGRHEIQILGDYKSGKPSLGGNGAIYQFKAPLNSLPNPVANGRPLKPPSRE